MRDSPDAVLFACTRNSVRSPMAEGLLKHLLGHRIYVDSVGVRGGVRGGGIDPFVIEVMDELGIDLSNHRGKDFESLEDTSYDLIVALSPQAQHQAVELTRTMACEVEFWNTLDPTIIEGNRETCVQAYREVRDTLKKRIEARFALDLKPVV